jgi:hypothetical protein
MTERERRPARVPFWLIYLWLAAGVVTFGLAFWGWSIGPDALDLADEHEPAWRVYENAAFMAVRAFGFDEAYGSLERTWGVWQLLAARWLGMMVFTSGVVLTAFSLLGPWWARQCARGRSGHILILGDHELAGALVDEAVRRKLKVTHLSTAATEAKKVGRRITLPRAPDDRPLELGRARAADRVIVAEADLGASIEGALSALAFLDTKGQRLRPSDFSPRVAEPRTPDDGPLELGRARAADRVTVAEADLCASVERALPALAFLKTQGQRRRPPAFSPRVAVHIDDAVTAERLHHAPGGQDLFAFSEAQGAAREVILRHPPFLLARKYQASAVHVVIVGFNRLGQALARDVMLNCGVAGLAKPWITVIDPEVNKADFLHLHPHVEQVCELNVHADLDEARLCADHPECGPTVCAAYVCHTSSAKSLAEAITLRERASKHDLIRGPIFVALRGSGLFRQHAGVAALQDHGFNSFGALKDVARICGALDRDPDALAKQVHETYSRVGGFTAERWDKLSEEMRVSNRRVVSHIPAKLASLGFDLEPWLAKPDDERPDLPELGEPLFRDGSDDRLATAILEHDRWIADRYLNGWKPGARNNDRKVHDCLIPYDHLTPDKQAYDLGIADWLAATLPVQEGGLRRE